MIPDVVTLQHYVDDWRHKGLLVDVHGTNESMASNVISLKVNLLGASILKCSLHF